MPRPDGAFRPARRVLLSTLVVVGILVSLLGSAAPAGAASIHRNPHFSGTHGARQLPMIPVRARPASRARRSTLRPQGSGTSSTEPHATAADGTTVSKVPDAGDGPTLSNWHVSYHGFTPQAQSAFQAAVNIWSRIIDTPDDTIKIEVDATFAQLDPGLLGQANSCGAYFNDIDSTYYPAPLAEALSGEDLDAADGAAGCDIHAQFTADPEPADDSVGYYFGTDGLPPAGQYDFESVVLHELGHGLGISGTMDFDDATGEGTYGFDDAHPDPLIFDRFTCDAAVGGNRMLSFTRGTVALGNKLQNGSVYWSGTPDSCSSGGTRTKLYAPGTWEVGSSYSHVDESAYPEGDGNSLMTAYLDLQESVHSPGPLVVSMLNDMGWSAALPVAAAPGPATAVTAAFGNARSLVHWTAPAGTGAGTSYLVTSTPDNRTCPATGGATSCTVTGLTNGQAYTFTVTATNSGGQSVSAASAPVTPDGTAPSSFADPFPSSVSLVTPVLAFHGTDSGSGIASYLIRYRVAPWNGGFGANTDVPVSATTTSRMMPAAKGSTLCAKVYSFDRANNSSVSPERCTTVAMDDRSLTTSTGWSRVTNSAYYAGTATTIAKAGPTLTRTSVSTRRLYVVAAKCSTCGVIGVYWNGKLLSQVNLANPSTVQHAVVLAYDLKSVQKGTLVLKAMNAKRLTIDGVGLASF